MNEVREMWRDYESQVKEHKRETYLKIQPEKKLSDAGIKFKTLNNGLHLIISHRNIVADFWPTTGKFNIRGGRGGYSVNNLIKILED